MSTVPRAMAAALAAAAWMVPVPGTAQAQAALSITTPYPAVAVQPGETTTFSLEVEAPSPQRVDLRVAEVPKGWSTTLRGGGFVIDGVFAGGDEPPDVQLEVKVAPSASRGVNRVVVVATGEGSSDTLTLDLRIARTGGGGVSLEPDFPALRGAADSTFTFNMTLSNDTPAETDFTVEAAGPRGWSVTATPSGQAQAATVKVAGGSTGSFTVDVDPPDDEVAGRYPIGVRAVGGGNRAEAQLEVEITGTTQFLFTTPDERLNADVQAGEANGVQLVVANDGTSPLLGVQFNATPPTGWEVEFQPPQLESVAPGQVGRTTAMITPSSDAITGDYVVTIDATVAESSQTLDLRTTVKAGFLGGVVGILLIVAALGGLGWVFRKYGRR